MKPKPELLQIPTDKLSRGKYQPRREFDAESLAELAVSIKSSGLIQPIVVRKIDAEKYEIVAGERRWRAAQLAELTVVPCLVNAYSDEETAAVTLIENMQRKDLNPIEEAQSLQRLIDEFGYVHEEVAAVVGKSRSKVTNCLRLLTLQEEVKRLLIDHKLSEAHGKILAGLPTKHQIEVAQLCVSKEWSVRKLEEEAKRWQNNTRSQEAPDDPNIVYLERILAEHIGSPVKVETDVKQKSGWLKIRYFDHDTLAGVLAKLGIENS